MIFTRRMVGFAAVLALSVGAHAAIAQDLKIMAPAAPGGGWDGTARSMQSALTAAGLAKNVQVSNVPGAGGAIGLAQFVNTAKGDGGQLMVNGFVMVGSLIMNKSPVNLSMVTPIARLTAEPLVIVVPEASPIKDAKGLIDAMKADLGKVTFAGGSAGGVDHILAGLLAGTIGLDGAKVNYVPFAGGGEALAALLSNRVTAGISGWGEFEGQVKAGKLRAIAITSKAKVAGNPTPTLIDQGVNLELINWRSVVAAPGISADQKKALSEIIDKLVKSKEWQDVLKQRGWDDAYLAEPQFGEFLKAEQVRVEGVLKSVGLVK
ncbi:MAG: tripartite tricarboxylate transporter substrate binding protein [Methylobacteriaceae bacterium]|nr:tripartite tricarboxylate transporter substrate binding protein [Methylobacteriaceae bacterium]